MTTAVLPPRNDATAARRLPSVDRLLRTPQGQAAALEHGQQATVAMLRAVLAEARVTLAAGVAPPDDAGLATLATLRLAEQARPSLRRVFNLTGTVLHTNLGRALLAEEAVAAVVAAMRHPATLEYDLASGARGERDDHVRALVRELTGAEDVCLVNNNAAAVLLVLNTLANGREALVSRGELIEIGGSFRLPDIMRRAGARLHEVGTTNRTHLGDFADAMGPRTGLAMRVHTSNYRIQGFTAEVEAPALAALCRERGVPLVDDLGSGTLVDLSRHGLRRERTVQDALKDGADLVTFSGDKLLGGPQAGFIAGRRDLVQRCARNHLKRSLRLDKLRLAALEATLRLYRDPDRLALRLPTLRLLARPQEDIAAQAARLLPAWSAALGAEWRTGCEPCASQIGSGALPLDELASMALVATPVAPKGGGRRLEALAARLRALPVPVIGRIGGNSLWLDCRCLDDEAGFRQVLQGLGGAAGLKV
jgi:L-seryl-tRNA(Ser) seleniumtransferase